MLHVPIIAGATYLLGEVIKVATSNSDKVSRFLPLIALVFGAALGVLIHFFAPSLIDSDNLFVAIISGAASGLSATGIHQAIKQLTQPKDS